MWGRETSWVALQVLLSVEARSRLQSLVYCALDRFIKAPTVWLSQTFGLNGAVSRGCKAGSTDIVARRATTIRMDISKCCRGKWYFVQHIAGLPWVTAERKAGPAKSSLLDRVHVFAMEGE